MKQKKIVIVGGGFAGIKCALELSKAAHSNLHVTLISNKPHFEYHGALYRLVAGHSPLEVCIPLQEIFDQKLVEIQLDTINNIDLKKKQLTGRDGNTYLYDILVLALGSETSYYHIPGLEKHAFGFKSIQEALELKKQLHESFESCKVITDKHEQMCNTHFVIVGGGASGTELAGELAIYTQKLATKHHIDSSLITIDVIQSPSRLLPNLPEAMTDKIEERLRSLGVNIFFNRRVIKKDFEQVYLKDIKLKAKTLIWTAGVTGNPLIKMTSGLLLTPNGQVLVNKYLQAKNNPEVYVLGDAAATQFTGMAQTALYDGTFVAKVILSTEKQSAKPQYKPTQPIYAIPVGPGWAAVLIGDKAFYGTLGWWLRRYLDWVVFRSLLPVSKALKAFRSHSRLSEECPICCEKKTMKH